MHCPRFNEVVFSAVEVRASQELIYRFNLEPLGSGKTLVEQRRDRDDVRWTLRSAKLALDLQAQEVTTTTFRRLWQRKLLRPNLQPTT